MRTVGRRRHNHDCPPPSRQLRGYVRKELAVFVRGGGGEDALEDALEDATDAVVRICRKAAHAVRKLAVRAHAKAGPRWTDDDLGVRLDRASGAAKGEVWIWWRKERVQLWRGHYEELRRLHDEVQRRVHELPPAIRRSGGLAVRHAARCTARRRGRR